MNDIYSVDRSRYLPSVLQKDPCILGLAKTVSGQMNTVAQEIRQNIIYPRMDELSEEILDILAYDLHVDWYDYSDDVETKRRIIRNSVKIHMKMGTKYAVETATSDVYPGTSIDEWFEYGGEPYFFRLNLDVSDKGITTAQQISLVERIYFYKNARSHLDYIAFHWEDTAEVRVGGYASFIKCLEIQPFLETEINLESTVEVGGFAQAETALKIQPFLETEIDLALNVDVQGATKAEHSIDVLPFLAQAVELETMVDVQGATKTETALEIQPFLTKQIELDSSGEIIIGAETEINQKIEIKEKENTE